MAKDKKTTMLTLDNVEYDIEKMNDKQRVLVQHCVDLDRKIGSAQFSLDQLQVGKQAFVELLKKELEIKEDKEE